MSDAPTPMTSHRPYLLRALYEWIADNGMTPHILVDARQPGVRVPAHATGRYAAPERARMLAVYGPNPDAAPSRIGGLSTLR